MGNVTHASPLAPGVGAAALLRYVWAYHRIGERLGQRRAVKFSNSLLHLAQAIPDLPETSSDAGYDPTADAVWIRRTALPRLTKKALAGSTKNLFAPKKNLLACMLAMANMPRERLANFAALFAEDEQDVDALRNHFKLAPEALQFRGYVIIGWGIQEELYWFGTTDDPAALTEEPEERAIRITRYVQAFPIPQPFAWLTPVSAREDDPRLTTHPSRVMSASITLLAGEYHGEVQDEVMPRTTLVRGLRLPAMHGDYLFWQPPTPSHRYVRPALRDALLELMKGLREKKCRPDYVVIVTTLDHETVAGVAHAYVRFRKLRGPRLLILSTKQVTQLLVRYYWVSARDLDYLRHPMPIMRAPSLEAFEHQAFLLLVLKIWSEMNMHPQRVPVSVVRRSWQDLAPGTNFDVLLAQLMSDRFCGQPGEYLDRETCPTIIDPTVVCIAQRAATLRVLRWILDHPDDLGDHVTRRYILLSAAQQWDLMHGTGAAELRRVVENYCDDERSRAVLAASEKAVPKDRRWPVPAIFY